MLPHRSGFCVGFVLLALAACGAPPRVRHDAPRPPRQGDRVVDLRAYYGVPILQKSFFWDGNGEDDDAGLRSRYLWHVSDRVALGAGLAAMVFMPGGPDAFAGEVEAVSRFYALRDDAYRVFGELTGGYLLATRPVPTGGTVWNFTFSFGLGVEVPIRPDLDASVGVTYHHISNALGRQNDRNPSQNEAQIWAGLSYRF